ncbi:MAG: MvaI/BcnI family restriction endonuclease [Flavobacteriaceae bacterium]|nr:MvaI/BcnI family restriction endonuclease [Flavobacteriaceae bacterium]
MELNKVINEINRIRGLGFVRSTSVEENDGAIGRTLEDLLGVAENNKQDPDFMGFEIKTQKQITKSPISLFTRAPNSPKKAMRLLRDTFGDYKDSAFPQMKKLYASVYANRWSNIYDVNRMKLNINYQNRQLELLIERDNNLFETPVYWNFIDIEKGLRKIDKLIVVSADKESIDSKTHFKFTKCRLFLQLEFDRFLESLRNGLIQFDIRLGIYKSGKNAGKYHNHGGGFRIKPKNLNLLYRYSADL